MQLDLERLSIQKMPPRVTAVRSAQCKGKVGRGKASSQARGVAPTRLCLQVKIFPTGLLMEWFSAPSTLLRRQPLLPLYIPKER